MITSIELKERTLVLAKELGLHPKDIQMRQLKKSWGTCSIDGVITLNEELLNQPEDMQIEVILHELLHLVYYNHGKMFKLVLKIYKEKYTKEVKCLMK